jgi:hypothetical protein
MWIQEMGFNLLDLDLKGSLTLQVAQKPTKELYTIAFAGRHPNLPCLVPDSHLLTSLFRMLSR